MSRRFNGSGGADEHITFAPGALSTNDGGPITVLFYWRPEETQFGGLIQGRASGAIQWAIQCDGGSYNTWNDFGGFGGFTVGVWQIIGYSKPDGNSVTARWHYWDSTGGWTHQDGASESDGVAIDELRIGEVDGGRLDGEWVCAAVWASELSDGQVETAASPTALQAWFDASPDALWAGDQASTSDPVTDLTGNGADQTATLDPPIDADEPPGWSYTISTDEDHSGPGQPASVVLTPGAGAGTPSLSGAGDGASLTLTPGAGVGTAAVSGAGAPGALLLTPGLGVGSAADAHSGAGQPASVILTPGQGVGAAALSGAGQPASLILTPGLGVAASVELVGFVLRKVTGPGI